MLNKYRGQRINNTECVSNLDKNNLLKRIGFRLKPIFTTTTAASKNDSHFKSGQKWLKNNHLASIV